MIAKLVGLVKGDQVLCEKNVDSAKVTLPLQSQFYHRKDVVAKNYREQMLTVLQNGGV